MEKKTNIFALTKQDTAVLKGIAVVAMLMHHLWGCAPSWVEPYTGVLGFFGSVGKVCVAIFLFCSGYGLSVGYSKVVEDCRLNNEDWKNKVKTTLKFLAKRFVKFYSGYWPIFFIFVPLGVFVFDRPLNASYGEHVNILKRLLLDIVGVQGYQSYNITWWFNKLIILLYLTFPVLYFCVKKGGWFFALISLICMRFSDRLDGINYYGILLWQCPMVLGILWHEKEQCFDKMKLQRKWMLYMLSVVAVVLLMTLLLYRYGIVPHIPHVESGIYMDSIIVVVMTLCVVLMRNYCKHNNVIVNLLGRHSMNTYLTHTFFFSYWFPSSFYSCELGGGINVVALLMICTLASIIIEWLKEKCKWNKLTNIILEKID